LAGKKLNRSSYRRVFSVLLFAAPTTFLETTVSAYFQQFRAAAVDRLQNKKKSVDKQKETDCFSSCSLFLAEVSALVARSS
jgi:hypothetical protein